MIDKITSVVKTENEATAQAVETAIAEIGDGNKIVTTEEEQEALYIVKSILSEFVPMKRLTAKDTETYFGILLDGNIRKWICRFVIKPSKITLQLPGEGKEIIKIQLTELEDIYLHKAALIEVLNGYLPAVK